MMFPNRIFFRKCFSSVLPTAVLSSCHLKSKCFSLKYKKAFICYKPSNAAFSTNSREFLGKSQVKELLIPNEYGNIAAKVWGNEAGSPILALHGWLDNCGTFDKLFPLLSNKFYIIALDAPGHGRSSHKPPGGYYTDISLIMDFKKVADFFNLEKFNIIGHSLGGCLALMFASIFPNMVNKLVTLDVVKPSSRNVHLFPEETIKAVMSYLEIEKKMLNSPPVYTVENAAKRLYEGMHKEVTLENAKLLNIRGTHLSECGKGVVFSRDMRCRTIEQFSRRSHEFVQQIMSAVKSELLMIMANNTHPNYATATPEVNDTFYEIYRKNSKRFVLKKVDGNHFVHMNNPERIAPLINEFLCATVK